MKNIGVVNEIDIAKNLNNKRFKELNEKWKEHMKIMFPFITGDDFIKCRLCDDRKCKPDIYIVVRHTCQYVSIKSGRNPSMHEEFFYTFANFLRKCKVSERTISIIDFYHFGRTRKLSNNGVAFTKDQIIEKYGNYLEEANKEINNKQLIEKIIYHCIIKGAKEEYMPLTYLYYGNVDKGFLLSIEDIYMKILSEKKPDRGPIHFGGLIYQPCGRREDRTDKNYSRIKWPILCVKYYNDDII